ncbi:MAG: hypothetical protein SP1CHLAM54_00100 [Chlamydiia bacterium]|nr:hypothetical protein [Chlamydiia bacterium]MCH9614936.1 hypothetical protein [Chlamydiia bacterium]MCH9629883.1 hypothetical protein [Chlamydiia bacterium]
MAISTATLGYVDYKMQQVDRVAAYGSTADERVHEVARMVSDITQELIAWHNCGRSYTKEFGGIQATSIVREDNGSYHLKTTPETYVCLEPNEDGSTRVNHYASSPYPEYRPLEGYLYEELFDGFIPETGVPLPKGWTQAMVHQSSDIWSFGVVLMEAITGQPFVPLGFWHQRNMHQIVDTKGMPKKWEIASALYDHLSAPPYPPPPETCSCVYCKDSLTPADPSLPSVLYQEGARPPSPLPLSTSDRLKTAWELAGLDRASREFVETVPEGPCTAIRPIYPIMLDLDEWIKGAAEHPVDQRLKFVRAVALKKMLVIEPYKRVSLCDEGFPTPEEYHEDESAL